MPWTDRTGQRVAVRYRLDSGGFTDVVGELTAVDTALHVTTRRGPVAVPLDRVTAGRVVPPRPSRPGPPHRVTSITDLEAVMSLHWRAAETEQLGGWLLRASAGFTGRANSMLPLGAPHPDPDRALAAVVAWYARRDLPAKAALAGTVEAGAPDDDGPAGAARAACDRAGWQLVHDGSALVLTAPTVALRGLGELSAGLEVTLSDAPDDGWLDGYRYRGQLPPPAAIRLLNSAPEQTFASIRDGGRTVAVARGSIGGGWAGLTAVEVRPEHRRRGLATVLVGAIAGWARRGGAASTYLQVADSNAAARAFYAGLGFDLHHRYDYLQAPRRS